MNDTERVEELIKEVSELKNRVNAVFSIVVILLFFMSMSYLQTISTAIQLFIVLLFVVVCLIAIVIYLNAQIRAENK
jgi:hypothetical protein